MMMSMWWVEIAVVRVWLRVEGEVERMGVTSVAERESAFEGVRARP